MNTGEVAKFVLEESLVWTMTTNSYKYYTLNMLKSIQEIARVPWKLCIICCDDESFLFFRREGIPCIPWKRGEQKGQTRIAGFGSQDFMKWNRIKLNILEWFAVNAKSLGIHSSLYIDGDIVFQNDPWPVLKGVWSAGGAGLLFQCDCANSDEHSGCGNICSGCIATLHKDENTPSYTKLYQVDEVLWREVEKQDQPYIEKRLEALGIAYETLPRRLFGNGHWQKSFKWKDDSSWILLHYNYRVGDTKKQAMRTYGHWRIPY